MTPVPTTSRPPRPETLSILIPVYNEEAFVAELLNRVLSVDFLGLARQIIVVDDGSTDGTRAILQQLAAELPITLILHDHNQGKGAALRTAIQHATGDIAVIQDADLEYDPVDYPPLIKLIVEGRADVVYGSRLSGGKPVRAFNIMHLLGNQLLTAITNLLYNTTLTDMETCYKAFRGDVLRSVIIRSNRFDFEPEITAKVLKKGYRIYEAPISYYGRDFHEGKKITWVDGLWALWTLARFRFMD
ncbi:MAG: glycosyltransferase family 2 protein [Candidatus Melainabacteria bacterium]